MENNLESKRKAAEPSNGAMVVFRSDKGHSQPAKRSSDGPPSSLTPKKARVGSLDLGAPRRDLNLCELIAKANNTKKRLTGNSLKPNPGPRRLERSVLSDSSPIQLGERQKNVAFGPNSDPRILKRSTPNCPTRMGLIASLKNVSAVRKSHETPKFAGKKSLIATELKQKQKQDPGVTPRPELKNVIKMPWHKALELALETGRALLLRNLDPGFSSCEIETMLTELLSVSCEARMQPPKDFSCYNSGEALVLFQSRVEAEGALLKLTENVLIWSEDQRPVVASLANKRRREKNRFHGFLNLTQSDRPNGGPQRTGGATSHCSQPNTVFFEMGTEWRVLQEQHSEAWNLAAQLHGGG